MKKIVLLLSLALSLPLAMMAQSNDDDLYFVPSKEQKKQEELKPKVVKEPKVKTNTTTIYTAPGSTVVIEDRKGNQLDARDVDEYNRRYSSRDNDFVQEGDTLFVKERSTPGLDGEWVGGEFEGSQDDYEYAERIIRFRNPRFAVSISSPLYWDIVYGANSWNWNVYTDGMYAYAFPTFTNPAWSSWRYGSFGWGWNYPYYSGYYPGYWGGGWYGGWYGGYWGHHHHYPGWGGGYYGPRNTYTNRSYAGTSNYRNSSTVRRYGSSGSVRSDRTQGTPTYSRGDQNATRRVVGTRTPGDRNGTSSRTDASSSRHSIYTRPSSTRTNSGVDASRGNSSAGTPQYSEGGRRASSRSSSTYTRGSSKATERSVSTERSSSRSYTPSRSSSGSSYSSPSGGSSRSYSTGGGGGSSRSSGGGGGSSRSRR